MEELTNIVSELYNTEIKPFEDYSYLKIDEEKLKEIGLFEVYKKNKSLYLWSGTQYVGYESYAWRLNLYADKVYYGANYRNYTGRYAICIGE